MPFKTLGNIYQGINSITEAANKKRDARRFIRESEARQRNFERQDFVNNAAQIQVSGEANRRALENINLGAAQGFEQASEAGVRGIGMIGKIQQNVNVATGAETDRLARQQAQVNIMAAQEQGEIRRLEESRSIRDQQRIDQMLERGQALRSQGAAELGAGVSQVGGALDEGAREAFAIAGSLAGGGGFTQALGAGLSASNIQPQVAQQQPPQPGTGVATQPQIPSLSNTPFNQFFQMRQQPFNF